MFIEFKKVVQTQMSKLSKGRLFITDVTKEELWSTYLNSFPNDVRQEYNCNACRLFITNYGALVGINDDYTLSSIWDVIVGGYYQRVADALKSLVLSKPIKQVFVTNNPKLGIDSNLSQDYYPIRWQHFYYRMPVSLSYRHSTDINREVSYYYDTVRVLKRSLEYRVTNTESVLELISSNNLYRGEEFKETLAGFYKLQKEFLTLREDQKDNFCWSKAKEKGASIRNNAIGTILIDMHQGYELEDAVRRYESVVAPSNYKRPAPIVTQASINSAQDKIKELKLECALNRRFATLDDITVNNVLFVDRSKSSSNPFDELRNEVAVNPNSFNHAQEISIEDLLSKVIPSSTKLEVLLENRHSGNLVSLITAEDKDAPTFFKWNNPFSWSYNNALADSIKEKVKNAGGKVDGLLRVSLAWESYDDYDLHLIEPNGNKIYYGEKRSTTGGCLDVDMNANYGMTRTPVENIIYPYHCKPLKGNYRVEVHNYCARDSDPSGYTLEVEYNSNGEVYTFERTQPLVHKSSHKVCSFSFTPEKGIEFEDVTPAKFNSKSLWGLSTNRFHRVNLITLSPNYWSASQGNKHIFLFLEGARNEGVVRPFFNEFIREDLIQHHKRVFELLGGKLQVKGENQLSGLGFSSTLSNSFIIRVNEGKIYKVKM